MHHFTTIIDIAKELNVSVSTVSRALRDTYGVSDETKKKIQMVAERMNYKPNYNAIGLANRRTHNIGVILPFIANYYYSTVITGIQEIAYSKGYNVTLFVTNDSPEREKKVMANLSASNIDGLLVCVSSPSEDCSYFEKVISEGTPVVFFDRVAIDIPASKVRQDDFKGAFDAVEHLIANGYKKIAHITGPNDLHFTKTRLAGYLAAFKKHGLTPSDEHIVHTVFSQECGEEDTYALMNMNNRPDAIFAVNDRKAVGAILALKKLKITIGKEVGVVGFTNDLVSGLISPSLTTIAEPAFEVGKLSCELLLKHISKKHFQAREIVLPGQLVVRESSIRS